MSEEYSYLNGYMSLHESEALKGAVPRDQRSPKEVPYGLIAEVINGSPFGAPRSNNLSTWFYRIQPSAVVQGAFVPLAHPYIKGDFCCPGKSFTPEPVRWQARPVQEEAHDFIEGLVTIAGSGNSFSVKGMAIHTFTCNCSMGDKSFYNSDGDMLIVPDTGQLNIQTEFGFLCVGPGEIFILPKGLKMTVNLVDKCHSRGFVCELFEVGHFQLPNLGPIGSNGWFY